MFLELLQTRKQSQQDRVKYDNFAVGYGISKIKPMQVILNEQKECHI